MDYGSGLWLHLSGSLLTRAPVARLGFAATGTDTPQLLGGLIEKEVGIVGHEVFLGTTIHPVVGVKRQVECGAL
jgi:hypothetical protein